MTAMTRVTGIAGAVVENGLTKVAVMVTEQTSVQSAANI
jgi:hypothetical protein